MKGRLCARAEKCEMESAFSFALGSVCSREVEREEAVAATERGREIDRAAACLTGVRQDAKISLPGEECFFLALNAASNAAAGVGKVALQELNAESHRGPYSRDPSEEARLPGVNGEPPLRVKGSSVVTFSASHWQGITMAGQDYGWRLASVATDGGTTEDAQKLTSEAKMGAEREEVVDAFNSIGSKRADTWRASLVMWPQCGTSSAWTPTRIPRTLRGVETHRCVRRRGVAP